MNGKSGTDLISEISSTEVPHGTCAYWWLGQHGFVIKLGEVILYIDPYLSDSPARNVEPLLNADCVTHADVFIGTHDHSDHIDRPVWPKLATASPKSVFLLPERVRKSVTDDMAMEPSRLVGLNDGTSETICGVKITAVPAAHELLSIDPENGLHEFLGVIIEGNGVCIYHAGDTTIYEGIQAKLRHWKLDLAFLPINGRDAKRLQSGCIGNMTYQEAVDLAGSIRPSLTVPTHFEMFSGNTEDPCLFASYMDVKYPGLSYKIPVHGVREFTGQ